MFPLITIGQTFSLSDTVFKVGDILRSNKIFFDLGKASLRPESKTYLDSMFVFLNKNKGLVIEVGNHTGCLKADYKKLSSYHTMNRAESIVNYLVEKGINPNRLIAKGYEINKPIITDSEIEKMKTEEEKLNALSVNRRTEFIILKTDYKE